MVFAVGPAGTGKTYTGVALAVKTLGKNKSNGLCKYIIEAGKGGLPSRRLKRKTRSLYAASL